MTTPEEERNTDRWVREVEIDEVASAIWRYRQANVGRVTQEGEAEAAIEALRKHDAEKLRIPEYMEEVSVADDYECDYCDFEGMESHYHCMNCGEVGGMMGHLGPGGNPTCEAVPDWNKELAVYRITPKTEEKR